MEDNSLQLKEIFFKKADENLKQLKKSRFFIKFCAINAILMFIFFIIMIIVSSIWQTQYITFTADGNILRKASSFYRSPDYIAGMAILGIIVLIFFILNITFSIIAVSKTSQIRDLTEEYFSDPTFNKNKTRDNNNWIVNQLTYSNLSIKGHLSSSRLLAILGIFLIPIVMYWISYYYMSKAIDNYELQIKYLNTFYIEDNQQNI